jgi:RNA polymerase subunit RPABC4/transcription elongation factor Spt4
MDLVETISNAVVVIAAFFGAFLAALWLSIVIWTFRDIRARSRDIFAQILATMVVAILTLPGLVIYIMVRPRETLAEAYDRSLEEEALLQSIEERETCPGCGQRAEEEWVICPYCHTRLKKHCHHCGRTIQLHWTVCPFCGTADRPAVRTTPIPPEVQHTYPPGSALAQAEAAQSKPEADIPAQTVDEETASEALQGEANHEDVEAEMAE